MFRTAKHAVDLQPYSERISSGTITKDDLRAERQVILDLYQHHLKVLLEANVFIYAVTGALLSFVATPLERSPHSIGVGLSRAYSDFLRSLFLEIR